MTVDFGEDPGSARRMNRSTLKLLAVFLGVAVACFAVAVWRISEINQQLESQASALGQAQAAVRTVAELGPQLGSAVAALKVRQNEVGQALAAAQADDPTGGQLAARLAPVRAANDAAIAAADAVSTAATSMVQGFQEGAARLGAGLRYASLLVVPPVPTLLDAPPLVTVAKTKGKAGNVSDTIKKVREETFQKRDRNDFLLKVYAMALVALFFLGLMYYLTKNDHFAEGCKLGVVAFVSSLGTYITSATV